MRCLLRIIWLADMDLNLTFDGCQGRVRCRCLQVVCQSLQSENATNMPVLKGYYASIGKELR